MGNKNFKETIEEIKNINNAIEGIDIFLDNADDYLEDLEYQKSELLEQKKDLKKISSGCLIATTVSAGIGLIVVSFAGGTIVIPVWAFASWVASFGSFLTSMALVDKEYKKVDSQYFDLTKDIDKMDLTIGRLEDSQDKLENELEERKNIIAMRVLKRYNKKQDKKKDND